MSLQAYTTAATRAESPRDMEYRLFGQVTRALVHASTVDASDVATRIDALDWNRRLWTALANDCSSPGNALGQSMRAQIISLGLWVERFTSDVVAGREPIGELISLNRTIMEGLRGQRLAA